MTKDVVCGAVAEILMSATFGCVFLSASFGDKLIGEERARYIAETVETVVGGIA